jgi:hypothetical protein
MVEFVLYFPISFLLFFFFKITLMILLPQLPASASQLNWLRLQSWTTIPSLLFKLLIMRTCDLYNQKKYLFTKKSTRQHIQNRWFMTLPDMNQATCWFLGWSILFICMSCYCWNHAIILISLKILNDSSLGLLLAQR